MDNYLDLNTDVLVANRQTEWALGLFREEDDCGPMDREMAYRIGITKAGHMIVPRIHLRTGSRLVDCN